MRPGRRTLDVMLTHIQDENISRTVEEQPDIEERVIVITKIFRCLGYLDDRRIWRYATDGARIENVIAWRRQR